MDAVKALGDLTPEGLLDYSATLEAQLREVAEHRQALLERHNQGLVVYLAAVNQSDELLRGLKRELRSVVDEYERQTAPLDKAK